MNKEIFYTDMAELFEPREAISNNGEAKKWCTLPYRNEEFSGTLISSVQSSPDVRIVSYDPKLKGWHKIFVGLPGKIRKWSYMKLSNDEYCTRFYAFDANCYEEMFWKCADMTDVSIQMYVPSILASLRFVPMNDEEIAEELHDRTSLDARNLYVVNDMNNTHYGSTPPSEWRDVISWFEHSDAEWFAPEYILDTNHRYSKDSIESDEYMHKVRVEWVDQAHKQGIKVAHSNRLGHWAFSYPYETYHKGHHLWKGVDVLELLKDCNCYDRQGEKLTAMSYAYPEVRKLKIDYFLDALRSGGEAVTLIACRGIPYVLFEKPVADAFYEKYGEYPYDRPLDDPELNKIHCDFMTAFVRELRETLDNKYGKGKIEIHLQALNTIWDTKLIGFDVEELAREGLVQRFITHDRRLVEFYPDNILKSSDPVRIDMEKFEEFFYSNEETLILDCDNNPHFTPTRNSKGEEVGPKSYTENIREWEAFATKYNVKIYHEIEGFCKNNESAQKAINDIYSNGGNGISIFNTPCRVQTVPVWNLLRKAGHRDMMKDADPYLGLYRKLRIHSIGECNYNRYSPEWLD